MGNNHLQIKGRLTALPGFALLDFSRFVEGYAERR